MKSAARFLTLLVFASGLPTRSEAGEIETYQLKPDLVVTPSRVVEPIDNSLASVSVITRTDIELSVAEDLFELLRMQPGIDIVRSGERARKPVSSCAAVIPTTSWF